MPTFIWNMRGWNCSASICAAPGRFWVGGGPTRWPAWSWCPSSPGRASTPSAARPAPAATAAIEVRSTLDSHQQVLRKRPLIVHPLRLRAEAASISQFRDLPLGVLMTALRPDRLARPERHGEAAPAYIHHLPPFRSQVHLDTAGRLVEPGDMLELAKIEVAVQFPVDPPQQVQVERRRHAQRIVVSFQHPLERLQKIGAEQQPVASRENAAHLAQKTSVRPGIEIADRAAQEQYQQVYPIGPQRGDLAQAVQVLPLDADDAYAFDIAQFGLARRQRRRRDLRSE